MLGHTGQVCPTLIPTRHTGETDHDDSLHKAFVSCANFRGKNSSSILQLVRDNLQDLYDRQYDIDAEHISHPEDFYTALFKATEIGGDNHTSTLDTPHTLYLFEFLKIVKIGGNNSPYACIEWPRI